MKIMISNDGPTAHFFQRIGLARVFNASGHQVILWDINSKPVMDAFDEFEPDIFIGQTYNTNELVCEAILERPHMKVCMKASDWGPFTEKLDKQKYPILYANQKEIDIILNLYNQCAKPDFLKIHYHPDWIEKTHGYWKEHGIPIYSDMNAADIFEYTNGRKSKIFESDICFVGGYWGYKSKTLDEWLYPLLNSNYNIKIFGNQRWPSHIYQYCGYIPNEVVKDAMASAKICINISELHSQDFGYDVIERPFKLLSNRCFVISDYVECMYNLFSDSIVYAKTPQEFKEKVDYFIENSKEKNDYITRGFAETIKNHTYFNRAADIMKHLGLQNHYEQILKAFVDVKKRMKINESSYNWF